jgi:plastocyanin domain-containing protein
MSIDQFIVLFFGVFGIWFTYWFFLAKKGKEIIVTDAVEIIVNGGYSPDVVVLPQGKTTEITFIRKDPSNCLEEVVLGDFNIKKFLPLNKSVTIALTPQKKGTFGYSCGMGMFHGKIIVR